MGMGIQECPQDFGLNNRKDESTSAKVTKAVGRMWKVDSVKLCVCVSEKSVRHPGEDAG